MSNNNGVPSFEQNDSFVAFRHSWNGRPQNPCASWLQCPVIDHNETNTVRAVHTGEFLSKKKQEVHFYCCNLSITEVPNVFICLCRTFSWQDEPEKKASLGGHSKSACVHILLDHFLKNLSKFILVVTLFCKRKTTLAVEDQSGRQSARLC